MRKSQYYKGIEIKKIWYNGFYTAFIVNKGYLKADTLKGIKMLITKTLKDRGY